MTDDNGTDTRRSHLTARDAGYLDGKRDALASAVARGAAPVRLVEAAKRVIDLYDEDQMDSLGFAARRMTAMTALRAALAEVDRG